MTPADHAAAIAAARAEGAKAGGPLVYLACPYSHPDHAVRVARFEAANRAAGDLMAAGHKVFSPISHTHPIAEAHDLPRGWDYWEALDRAYLGHSNKVVVLRVDGWRESKGVQAEIAIAAELGLPVEYIDPAQPAPPLAPPPTADAPVALEWRQPKPADFSDYFEAQLPGGAFLDVIESHSGWKCRLWIRDEHVESRLASPVEHVRFRTADEAKAAALPMLREWAAGLLGAGTGGAK